MFGVCLFRPQVLVQGFAIQIWNAAEWDYILMVINYIHKAPLNHAYKPVNKLATIVFEIGLQHSYAWCITTKAYQHQLLCIHNVPKQFFKHNEPRNDANIGTSLSISWRLQLLQLDHQIQIHGISYESLATSTKILFEYIMYPYNFWYTMSPEVNHT